MYITKVSVALIINVPSIVFAVTGSHYTVIGFPPIFCGITSAYRVYVIVIPVVVIDIVIVTLMILVVYKLHMVSLRI